MKNQGLVEKLILEKIMKFLTHFLKIGEGSIRAEINVHHYATNLPEYRIFIEGSSYIIYY